MRDHAFDTFAGSSSGFEQTRQGAVARGQMAKDWRKSGNLTQSVLAEKIDTYPCAISTLERGLYPLGGPTELNAVILFLKVAHHFDQCPEMLPKLVSPVTETPNTGTPEVLSHCSTPAASGKLAGGSSHPSAPLFQHPAPRGRDVGEGRGRGYNMSPKAAPPASRKYRLRDIAGNFAAVAALFVILFVLLHFGGVQ